MILTDRSKAIARDPLRLSCQSSSYSDRVFGNLRDLAGVIRGQTTCLMNGLTRIDMESLGIILQRLLVEGPTLRIHTLIACFHGGDLVCTELFFLLILVVVESSLHGVSMSNHRLHRVILSIGIYQGVLDFIFIWLVAHHIDLVLRLSKVIRRLSFLSR